VNAEAFLTKTIYKEIIMATDITSKDHELFYMTCLLCAELDEFLKELLENGFPINYYPRLQTLERLKNRTFDIVLNS
jgi:hypothetical protein